MSDYIVSQGKSTHGWYWTKYASGIATCFQNLHLNVDMTASSSFKEYGNIGLALPFTFTGTPTVNATVNYENKFIGTVSVQQFTYENDEGVNAIGFYSTLLTWYVPTTKTYSVNIHFTVSGWWK